MNTVLINKIPSDLKNSLPVNVFFVKGITIESYRNKNLFFANSEFYNTKKMSCYNFYKPSFLRKLNDK